MSMDQLELLSSELRQRISHAQSIGLSVRIDAEGQYVSIYRFTATSSIESKGYFNFDGTRKVFA